MKLQGKKLPRSLPIKLQDPLYSIFWRFYCILYFFWVTVSNKCTAWAGEPRAGSQELRLRCLRFSRGRKCWFKNSTATFCSPKKNPQSIQLHTIKCKLCCVKQGIPHTAAAHLDTACTKIVSLSPCQSLLNGHFHGTHCLLPRKINQSSFAFMIVAFPCIWMGLVRIQSVGYGQRV